jgi:tetratricopeptide (TPR) repeat protein
MKSIVSLITVLSFLVFLAPAIGASVDGSNTGKEANNSDYTAGEKAIKAKNWQSAVEELLKAVDSDPTNANAQNYLGYAYRNLGQYKNALKHYKEALRLDPKHRGAHEYLGETYLKLNDVASAKKHLLALEKICSSDCEEYIDLKEEIEEYEKSKN